MLRHVANALAAGRLVAAPCVAGLLVYGQGTAAFTVYAVAMFTDLFDGALARLDGGGGPVGILLDAMADKALVGISWIALWLVGWAPGLLVGAVLFRDGAVAIGWWVARARDHTWQPSPLGQVALSLEAIALGVLLFHGPWLGVDWPTVGIALGVEGVILSWIAGLAYAATAWRDRGDEGVKGA